MQKQIILKKYFRENQNDSYLFLRPLNAPFAQAQIKLDPSLFKDQRFLN